MQLGWVVEPADTSAVHALVRAQGDNLFVLDRIRRNVDGKRQPVTREQFWYVVVMCLLTTQQRSSPNSPVSRFIARKPFPLALPACERQEDLAGFAESILTQAGGIRRAKTLGKELSVNLALLSQGAWPRWERLLQALEQPHDPAAERDAAAKVMDAFTGVGPKQARNILQTLGLTQHEIPLDSRIVKWLNRSGFPIELSATALADRHYYNFVSEGVQALCRASGVLPCVLDAAIFTSFDAAPWTPELLSWSDSGHEATP